MGEVNIDSGQFGLGARSAEFGKDLAPWVNDEAVPVAGPLLIVLADLRSGNDIGLGFDGSSSQQDFPVGITRGWREGRGKGNDLTALAPEG